ncbi:hypothetical protein [Kutzneria albida]|uniref:Uncharacterized protein n=1 Tax=Kutzneria albida DSM 43870 TaxID=1449976 RepID=W5WBG9_9PSEU|nr:hypothetical protein [Kutzneria albida]AHH97881.1 hypothetical protein KALB_4519 [Kutzneria albida DSM 43870]
MSTPKILVRVPDDLVPELVAAGLAEQATTRRSGNWEVVASWLTGAGTVISLLQGPETIGWLAKALFKRKKDNPRASTQYLTAKGEAGELRIPITESTSVEDIERLLTATLFPADRDKR